MGWHGWRCTPRRAVFATKANIAWRNYVSSGHAMPCHAMHALEPTSPGNRRFRSGPEGFPTAAAILPRSFDTVKRRFIDVSGFCGPSHDFTVLVELVYTIDSIFDIDMLHVIHRYISEAPPRLLLPLKRTERKEEKRSAQVEVSGSAARFLAPRTALPTAESLGLASSAEIQSPTSARASRSTPVCMPRVSMK